MSDRIDNVTGFPSVLKDLTDDKLESIKRKAAAIVQQDVDINAICSTLIASRQLYALARFALHRDLTAEGHVWEDGIEECLIKAMATKADLPFTRAQVLQALELPVRKFMFDEIQLESEQEKTERLMTESAISSAKDAKKVVIPGYLLTTGDTLLVVGKAADVAKRLQLILEAPENHWANQEDDELATSQGLNDCVRVVWTTKLMPEVTYPTLMLEFPVGVQKWTSVANSRAGLEKLFQSQLSKTIGNRCDLLIVEDIALAYNTSFTLDTVHCPTNVCGGIKAIRRLVQEAKGVLVAGVIAEGDVTETAEDLRRRYKDVKGVYVEVVSPN